MPTVYTTSFQNLLPGSGSIKHHIHRINPKKTKLIHLSNATTRMNGLRQYVSSQKLDE